MYHGNDCLCIVEHSVALLSSTVINALVCVAIVTKMSATMIICEYVHFPAIFAPGGTCVNRKCTKNGFF